MAAVTRMDDAIGNVLDLVDSLGLEKNTLVIFFSDNGGSSIADNYPLSGGKATMWEGGLRVPCMIKWPEEIEKGKVIDNFISSLELFPTILDAAGIEKPESLILDGFSIYPLLIGEKEMEREEMYWDFRAEYAARVGQMKWIKSEGRENMNGFFDLSVDAGEKNDLTNSKIQELNRVQGKFNQWKEKMDQSDPRGPFRNY